LRAVLGRPGRKFAPVTLPALGDPSYLEHKSIASAAHPKERYPGRGAAVAEILAKPLKSWFPVRESGPYQTISIGLYMYHILLGGFM
jgi:hypothetical protein